MWSNFESMPGLKAKSILAAGIMLLCLVSCKSSSSLTSSAELKEIQNSLTTQWQREKDSINNISKTKEEI